MTSGQKVGTTVNARSMTSVDAVPATSNRVGAPDRPGDSTRKSTDDSSTMSPSG